jgi:hypothetical protein
MIAECGRCLHYMHHLAKLWVLRYRERTGSIDDLLISSELLLT